MEIFNYKLINGKDFIKQLGESKQLFVRSVFTHNELMELSCSKNKDNFIAKLLLIKYVIIEVLSGTYKISPREFEIKHDDKGAPHIRFLNDCQDSYLSISDEGDYIAVCVLINIKKK